jgi:hypothetical protein
MSLHAEVPQSPESSLPKDLATRKETVRAHKRRDGRTINTAQTEIPLDLERSKEARA